MKFSDFHLFLAQTFKHSPVLKAVFVVLSDVLAIILSVWFAFLLRFEGAIPPQYFQGAIQGIIVIILLCTIPLFFFSRLYSFSWSYVSTTDLLILGRAVLISYALVGITFFALKNQQIFLGFPRSVLLVSALFMFFFTGGMRFAKRIVEELAILASKHKGKRVLIVGAGDAGAHLVRNMMGAPEYSVVGFVDDDPLKKGHIIHGVRVLGDVNRVPELVSAYQIEEMIIALPSAGSHVIRKAVEQGRSADLSSIKIVPPISEILNGEVSLRALREVQVEDLLGREVVSLDMQDIERFIRGKTVLITGAAGSIGSELSRQVSRFHPSLLLLADQDETGMFYIARELEEKFPFLPLQGYIADIRDKDKVRALFRIHRPSIVFHAAAYKHVPLMEANPDEAVKNNVFGTLTLGEAALEHGVQTFVFISTDKAVNPTSVMGATKRIGEMICQMLNQKNGTKFISVRFGNVLASRGSVISIFKEQIKRGGPVTVTHPDMKRYFMSTSEACLLVMQAGALGKGGEVFVLDMGNPVKIVDLAAELIRLSGLEPDHDIPIVFTGIRPGEKLFEEILSAEEGVKATEHYKIFQAYLSQVDEAMLLEELEQLRNLAETEDKKTILASFQRLLPSYTPRSLAFESGVKGRT